MSRPLPRHLEIAEALTRRIVAGLIPDGARLPPEREMAVTSGVAVGTLRKALALLQAQGLLQRVQGSGNYVRRQAAARSVYGLFRLELPEGGGLPTAQVLSLEACTREAVLPPGGPASRIRRLRQLDGRPVAVEEIWYLGPGVPTRAGLSDSLYSTWAGVFGQVVSRVEDRIGMGPFPDWTPPDLPFAAGGMGVQVIRQTWAEGAADPFEWSLTWFDADRARFVSREGGERWQSVSSMA